MSHKLRESLAPWLLARNRFGLLIKVAAVGLFLSVSNIAAAAADQEMPSPEEGASSYKTEMLIAHAAPLAAIWTLAIVADAKNGSGFLDPFGITAASSLVLTPPIVHASHGNWGRSAASFGINFVAWLPGLVTMMTQITSEDRCSYSGFREICDYRIFKTTAAVHTIFGALAALPDIAMADVGASRANQPARTPSVQGGLSAVPGGLMLGAQGVF